ncbi:hypothetical protein [Stutzerimonas nitrititolerans]|uniref:hypothetical protein n=1 Tax=Stutzerimonas nitrititolerans TaxID=2482751 RepID=UPI00289C49F3|nr:hypothetical protein [Stutzerimonas nitrititolerans]
MSLLNDCDYETTTLLNVIQKAEQSDENTYDMVHLTLDSGRELILLAVTAEQLDPMADLLESVRIMREER